MVDDDARPRARSAQIAYSSRHSPDASRHRNLVYLMKLPTRRPFARKRAPSFRAARRTDEQGSPRHDLRKGATGDSDVREAAAEGDLVELPGLLLKNYEGAAEAR